MRTTKSEILRFEVLPAGARVVRVNVYTQRTDTLIGAIEWQANWYQYALVPAQDARYGVRVLAAINRQVGICMRAWERSNAKSKASHDGSAPARPKARSASAWKGSQENAAGASPQPKPTGDL